MTFNSELIADNKESSIVDTVMALVDEFGNETPITELDIRRSLKQMSEETAKTNHKQKMYDLLDRVNAARAIA